jgi:hypothetical protein
MAGYYRLRSLGGGVVGEAIQCRGGAKADTHVCVVAQGIEWLGRRDGRGCLAQNRREILGVKLARFVLHVTRCRHRPQRQHIVRKDRLAEGLDEIGIGGFQIGLERNGRRGGRGFAPAGGDCLAAQPVAQRIEGCIPPCEEVDPGVGEDVDRRQDVSKARD